MLLHLGLLVWVVAILTSRAGSVKPPVGRYQHFDDYLSSLDKNEQAWITGEVEEDIESSGDPDNGIAVSPVMTRSLPIRSGLMKNKDVTCCMLGQMAGDKGYHCFVKYYAVRLLMRNRNRAHNRKMSFYGRDKIPNYGEKLMKTFEQCVAGRGTIFHKCCHLAALERPPQTRYDTIKRDSYKKMHKKIDIHPIAD